MSRDEAKGSYLLDQTTVLSDQLLLLRRQLRGAVLHLLQSLLRGQQRLQ